MRTFIAVLLSSEIKNKLAMLLQELIECRANVKWVGPENLHLTLQFLGEVSPRDLQAISSITSGIARDFTSFSVQVKGTGAFPEKGSPRVIWVGAVSHETEKIWRALNQSLAGDGWVSQERKFTAHITMGRVRDWNPPMEKVMKILDRHREDIFGSLTVKKISLMESRLTKAGPIYAELAEFPLQENI